MPGIGGPGGKRIFDAWHAGNAWLMVLVRVLEGATGVKKILIVAIVALICLGAVAVAGCGDDMAQATSYMEEGDALSAKMRAITNDAVFDAGTLLAELGIQISETGNVKPQTLTDTANKQIDSIIANGEKAKAEYEKILALKGVDAYKDYARQRMSAIDRTITVLEAVQGLFGEIGDPNNKASISSTITDWTKASIGVAVDAVRAFSDWRSADKIKKDNNLGPLEEVVQDSAPTSSPK